MGSLLEKLLTNPEDFKFYTNNQKGVINPNNQNPRTIPFGNDKPGGGNSNQPYIKKKLLNTSLDPVFYNDFTIRGGALALLKANEDVIRLTKYFADIKNPKGLLFLAKENILSRIGTKTEASKGAGYSGGSLNEGAYTPLSTIEQALVGFAGGHLNKQGLDSTGRINSLNINKYQDVIAKNQINLNNSFNFSNNRLTSLYTSSVSIGFNSRFNEINEINDYLLLPQYDESTLIQYEGGPGSESGIGKTKIKYATKNNGTSKLTVFDPVYNINSFSPPSSIESNTENLLNNSTSLSILNDKTVLPLLSSDSSPLFPNPNSNKLFNLLQKFPSDNKNIANFPLFKFGAKEYSSDTLFQYIKGPGSQGQINGKTNIKYATKNDGVTKLTVFDKNKSSNLNTIEGSRYKTWDYSLIENIKPINLDGDIKDDFRTTMRVDSSGDDSTFVSFSPKYTIYNIEDNLNLGNPGRRNRNRSSYTKGSDGGKALDTLNASPIYKSKANEGYKLNDIHSDIIPFIISILNNDDQSGGPYRKSMHFRSFINSFSDSYDADWSSIEYMGRAEKLYKYKGFGRKISMGFTVVAQSREEINIMYNKLNFLASSLAPEYLDSLSSGYMAGNIAYITLGEYIYDQPGIITSLTFDIPEESPWEIGINDDGNHVDVKDVIQVPHMIKVTGFNFIPIHKFRPEKQTFKNDNLDTDNKQRYVGQQRPKSSNQKAQTLKENDNLNTTSLPLLTPGLIPRQNNQNTLQGDTTSLPLLKPGLIPLQNNQNTLDILLNLPNILL